MTHFVIILWERSVAHTCLFKPPVPSGIRSRVNSWGVGDILPNAFNWTYDTLLQGSLFTELPFLIS